MHEDPRTIKAVDWKAVFPSLNLLRAFGDAIQPGKLLLGLALILVIYTAGRTMDFAWGWAMPKKVYALADPHIFQLPTEYKSQFYDVGGPSSGPFDVFMKWELTQLSDMSDAAVSLNFPYMLRLAGRFLFDGPMWIFQRHAVFAILLSAISLLAWAIFGGAIARMSAIQLARDAKISSTNALRFSTGKVLSFLTAPMILAIFVGGLGFAIALSNLVFTIPIAGPVVVGLAFIVTLAVGFLLTLAAIGSIFGFSLLYPTIAVEGTDAFDAVSTSFTYLVHKPAKMLGYLFSSLVYGALAYAVVKWFALVMFGLIKWLQMSLLGAENARHFDEFFPGPSALQLSYTVNYVAMHDDAHALKMQGMRMGAWVLSFWYFLVVGVVGAFVISFYFSASTITYSLLRLAMDATDLDEVYLEDADDGDLLEAPAPPPEPSPEPFGAPAGSPVAAVVPGLDAKPEEETGEQPSTWSASPPIP